MAAEKKDPGQRAFFDALRKHRVSAEVMHLDHYRVKGGVAVRTDYIILVQTKTGDEGDTAKSSKGVEGGDFDPFMMSKTYTAFRTLAHDLKHAADAVTTAVRKLGPNAAKVAKYCELVTHLVDSQRPQYLGKVSAGQVKKGAKQRAQIVDGVLEATCQYFPNDTTADDTPSDLFVAEVASILELFFLTDHCSDEEIRELGAAKQMEADKESEQVKHPILNPLAGIMSMLDKKDKNKEGGDKKDDVGEMAVVQEAGEERKPSSRRVSKVVPLTRKDRRSSETRAHDEAELSRTGSENLVVDDYWNDADHKPKQKLQPARAFVKKHRNSPFLWFGLAGTALVLLSRAAAVRLQLDADWGLLLLFAAYCLGYHTPHAVPETTQVSSTDVPDRTGRKLIRRTFIRTGGSMRRSMASTLSGQSKATPKLASISEPEGEPAETMTVDFEYEEAMDEDEHYTTPMQEFPAGAELGTINNCWGRSQASDFKIRGANYLKDKKKIPSKEFFFPILGAEVFLTDTCPENVGRNPAVLGGKMRNQPTFLINFRLPWGVLVLYFEIPEKFVPYLRACYEPDAVDKEKLVAAMKNMTNGERCVCRFLLGDSAHKNGTFKIVPVVVKGPWVVKSVVGGKPALIGTKLPINYVYEPAKDGKALYWELDLDIAASSAARGILSVCRTYTQILTMDLGFVVQANEQDELPEQMLVGCRMHGIDPLTAPSYPPIPDDGGLFQAEIAPSSSSADDDSVTSPAQE